MLIVPPIRLVYFSLRCQQSESYAPLRVMFNPLNAAAMITIARGNKVNTKPAHEVVRARSEHVVSRAGIQSVLCFTVAFIVYDHQPQVSASADALADFYEGDRMRILIMAVLRRGCPQSHVVPGGAQDAWRLRDKTVGAGRPPLPVPRRAFLLLIAVVAAGASLQQMRGEAVPQQSVDAPLW